MVTVSARPLNNSASIWAFVLSTRPTISGARTTAGAAATGAASFSHWQSAGCAAVRNIGAVYPLCHNSFQTTLLRQFEQFFSALQLVIRVAKPFGRVQQAG